MKQTPRLALLTLSLGVLSACSTETRVAPIIDRPTSSVPISRPRRRPRRRPRSAADAPGTYTVRRGDTLLRIALDHGQSYRDLVTWNNLSDPDDIKVGQVLRGAPERAASAVVTTPIAMPGADKPAAPPKKTAARRQEAVHRRHPGRRPEGRQSEGREGRPPAASWPAAPSPPATTKN
jgi:lipoprotein NlpD